MVWQKAAVPSGSCIAVVKFLECKLRAGLCILVARMSEKFTQHLVCLKLR